MATFVLVHGAWHGSWCWELIKPLLELRSHRVLTPDLQYGDDAEGYQNENIVGLWADKVASIIDDEVGPVILVGHSRGGLVISEVAERRPDRIEKLVYMSAFLVPPSKSLNDMRDILGDGPDLLPILDLAPDFSKSRIRSGAGHALFYNRVPSDWLAAIDARLGWEPHAAHAVPLALTPENYGRVPRAYIENVDDQIISIALQRELQRQQPCEKLFTLQADHSPFYSAPFELAAALDDIANSVSTQPQEA